MTSSSSETITIFSPFRAPGHSPEEIRELILTAAAEDGADFIGVPFANADNVTIEVAAELINDNLGWLDDFVLAEGLGLQHNGETLRFGDEDINFTIKMRGDDDARIGASRLGLEPLMMLMHEDADFITISRFDLDNPADESTYIKARSFDELDGWTLEYSVAGVSHTTIVPDVSTAITTVLRWMNGEDIRDLDWSTN
ncbi:hypothetical protein SFC07_08870 [Corynebacterium callunae]|uniref:hypothetical protein n=1 Tax=Corynebacterium callunae TaxID=1721 RepID=UPI0039825B9F